MFDDKRYLKFFEACTYLSVSKSFIKSRLHKSLIEGKHFYKLPNSDLIRFDKNALDDWVKQKYSNQEILNKILKDT